MFEQARLEQMNQELNENIIHNQIKSKVIILIQIIIMRHHKILMIC